MFMARSLWQSRECKKIGRTHEQTALRQRQLARRHVVKLLVSAVVELLVPKRKLHRILSMDSFHKIAETRSLYCSATTHITWCGRFYSTYMHWLIIWFISNSNGKNNCFYRSIQSQKRRTEQSLYRKRLFTFSDNRFTRFYHCPLILSSLTRIVVETVAYSIAPVMWYDHPLWHWHSATDFRRSYI